MQSDNREAGGLIRSFVALRLTPQVYEVLADIQDTLRKVVPRARWTRPEGTHLTLKFLGDVVPGKIDEIAVLLDQAAAHHKPFKLKLDGVGAFPRLRFPRVIWVGIKPCEELTALQKEVEDALQTVGFDPEKRAYKGHLTLARLNGESWSEEQRRIFLETDPTLLEISFPVDEVIIFRSDLSKGGAIYTPLHVSHLPRS